MKNILILGGLGFIGKNIIEEFLNSSDSYNIIVFDRPQKQNFFGNRIQLVFGDFNNEEDLDRIFISSKIDLVLHLISTTVPATSNEKIIYDIEANLIPTIRLLRKMVQYKVPEIIFLSSGGSVYGVTSEDRVDENHSTFPISSHGTIKLAIEKYIHLFQELYGINYLILRVGNPYGPFQSSDDQGIINVFIRKILMDQKLTVRGDGSAIRDYIYVKDLAIIIQLLINREIRNEIINVGSGTGSSINEIVDILYRITGKKTEVEYSDPFLSDVPRIILNTDKLKSFIRHDLYSIGEGIKETYKWVSIDKDGLLSS